jgi:hypothetical protein
LRLICGEPTSQSHAQFLEPSYASYAGSQIWAEQPGLHALICMLANSTETKVYGARREFALLHVHSISHDNRAIEREPLLRAVPIDEFVVA